MASNVKHFYSNVNVLISGPSGLVGKLLIQKLLRECDISGIYIIIRDKKQKSAVERGLEIFEDAVSF